MGRVKFPLLLLLALVLASAGCSRTRQIDLSVDEDGLRRGLFDQPIAVGDQLGLRLQSGEELLGEILVLDADGLTLRLDATVRAAPGDSRRIPHAAVDTMWIHESTYTNRFLLSFLAGGGVAALGIVYALGN